MVSSQQQDPIRGLCDNSSAADSLKTNTKQKIQGSPMKKQTTQRLFRSQIYLCLRRLMSDNTYCHSLKALAVQQEPAGCSRSAHRNLSQPL